MSTRNIPGGKGGRRVRLTISPPSCAEYHELWEPKAPGTLRAIPGLLRDWFIFTLVFVRFEALNHQCSCKHFLSIFMWSPCSWLPSLAETHSRFIYLQNSFFCGITPQFGRRPPHCWGLCNTHGYTHTLQDSSGRLISSSQRPLPTQQTTNTGEHTFHQRDSSPRSK
jgi:hypothetical protein